MIDRRSLLAAAALLPVAARARESIQFTRHWQVAGPGLLPRNVDVWRPEDRDGEALPLLLMHDGQNLFEPASSYGGATWQVAETVTRLVAAGAMPPVMVAGVWNSAQRWRDYVPAGLLDRLPVPIADRFRAGNGGGSQSPAYVDFLADIVVPMLRDKHKVTPGKVAVMGSSMGGLISLAALMTRPDVFDRAGCLSTHWPVWVPAPDEAPTVEQAISGWLGEIGPPRGRRLWCDHGDRTLDQHYAPFQAVADVALAKAGWRRNRDFVSRAYPGTAHDEASWAARLADPLTFLFKTG